MFIVKSQAEETKDDHSGSNKSGPGIGNEEQG